MGEASISKAFAIVDRARPSEDGADHAHEIPESLHRRILDAMPVELALFDVEGRFRYLNPSAVADPILRRWLIGKTEHDYCRYRELDTIQAERRQRWLERACTRGTRVSFEETLETADGKRHFVRTLVPVRDDRGEIERVIGYGVDVTARRACEAEVKKSDTMYRNLFEQSRDVVYISTPGGQLLDINQAGLELLDIADPNELEAIDLARDFYVDPWQRQRLRVQLTEHGFVKDHELHLKTRRGEQLVVEATATAMRDDRDEITAYLGILRDVSAQRRLEGKLRQTQKMAAVERISQSLSREFNDLLTSINGYSDLLLHQLAEASGLRTYVEEIRDAGRRAARLIDELSALGWRSVETPLEIDLNGTVRHLETLLRRMAGETVRLRVELEPGLPRVRVDPAQLEQALINWTLSARGGLPDGGELRITTGTAVLDAEEARAIDLEAGSFARLEVEDDGIGIDPAAREQVFEPFFAAKDQGSGHGLASIYAMARQNGGGIELDSDPGQGTTIRIFLPIAARATPRAESAPDPRSLL